ncbi:transposase [Colletotrichum incanum]|nr:transposase [Colletotrichum incanum]
MLQEEEQPSSQQWDESVSIAPWLTPRRSADLRHQLHQLSQLCKGGLDTHTIRHLSRKVQKGWDNQASRLALLEQQVKALQAQLDSHRNRRGKRAPPLSPNSAFTIVTNIQQSQQSDDNLDSPDEFSVSESRSEAESCIWVVVDDGGASGNSGSGGGDNDCLNVGVIQK